MLHGRCVGQTDVDLCMVPQVLPVSQLTIRKLSVKPKDVVYVKGIAQASDGLCCVFSEGGGHLSLASAEDRAADLQQLVQDIEIELDGGGD